LTSPDGKPHNQIDNILIDKGSYSIVLYVQSFRAADCDTDHYLVVAKIRERTAMNKQRSHNFHRERFHLRNLNEFEVKEKYHVEASNSFAPLKSLDADAKTYYELTHHKPWFGEDSSELLDHRK
jgi:hypothetical protein